MDMQALHAGFETQDQAESAIRKLAALRSDRFRLSRATAGEAFGSETDLADASAEFAEEIGLTATGFAGNAIAFTLSANVPDKAREQARAVIEQAGGRIL
ncbi:hypothetical protein ACFPPD_00010 [Cohnella suwonensis]|uniref:Uncharacterized protein n=1 Tax=Cohnella suwonensis TaxID=696072 RepID=A0ABW0LMG8_9BACL